MANKTVATAEAAEDFLARAVPERRAEGAELDALFRRETGFAPVVWGGAMLGYGRYRYLSADGRENDWFATGFAPRKADLVIYILAGYADRSALLADLGPHRIGKSCLYVRRLDKVDRRVLGQVIRAGLEDLAARWPVFPA